MTGGVTFYTSFEVQPITTIMLKESVQWRRGKKNFTSMLHNVSSLCFEGRPSLCPRSVCRWEGEFTLTCFVSSPGHSCCQDAATLSLHARYSSVTPARRSQQLEVCACMHVGRRGATADEWHEHTVQILRSKAIAEFTLYGSSKFCTELRDNKNSTFFHSHSENLTQC